MKTFLSISIFGCHLSCKKVNEEEKNNRNHRHSCCQMSSYSGDFRRCHKVGRVALCMTAKLVN